MKKNVSIVLLVALVISIFVSFTGCGGGMIDTSQTFGSENDGTNETEEETEENVCNHVLKESIYKEPMHGVNGIKVISCANCDFFEYVAIPALPDVFELCVNDKLSYVHEDPDTHKKECVVVFDIDITNISDDKTIKYISGNLIITGINGIFNLKCEFSDISISPKETKNINNLGFSFDYASLPTDIERRVYDAAFTELKFTFDPSEVVVNN